MSLASLHSAAVADRRVERRVSFPRRDGSRLALLSSPQAAALIEEWRDLARSSAEENVFFHPGMLLPAIDHLDGGIRIAAVRGSEGRLIALAPVDAVRFGRVAPAVRLWVHDFAAVGSPLIDAGALAAGAEAIVDGLPGDGSLIVPALPLDGPVAAALAAAARAAGRPVHVVGAHWRAVLGRAVAGDGLRAALPSRRRGDFARQMRRLGERGTVALEVTGEPDRVRARFEEFLWLEARGWRGQRGLALVSTAAYAAFARDVVFNRSERGTVRLASIRFGERPVAIAVAFVAGATAYAWRLTYDADFARYSPGAQLMLDLPGSLLEDPDVAMIDSCSPAGDRFAASLWPDRMSVGTLVVGPPGGSLLHNAGLAAFRAEIEARAAARRLRTRLA
ncbi:MAG: GNAT family N-acetyltransferase [Bauldia sp.]|nr:GNAT family N-acetyltransferase [Bauldia sp.]